MKDLSSVSIPRKLVLITMAITLLGLISISISLAVFEQRAFKRDMVMTLSTLAEVIGSNSTAALTFGDRRAAEETISALKAEHHVESACIYSIDHSLFAAYRRDPGAAPCPRLPDPDGWRFQQSSLMLASGIFLERERIGTIFVRSDLGGLKSRMGILVTTLLVMTSVIGLLSYLLSINFQRLISEPILELVAVSRRISQQRDYSIRAIRHSSDEIGLLVDSFNGMLGHIQERDLSIRRSNEELKTAKESAESASRIKSEFLDIAAHELRTPLTVLILMIGDLQRRAKQHVPIQLTSLDQAAQQADRLNELVDDLLSASRLERGLLAIRPKAIDLVEVVSQYLQSSQSRFSNRKITFTQPPGPVEVNADPARIIQVLGNFLDNAMKYTPQGSPIEIGIEEATAENARVSVTDHGKGIPKEQQANLFTRFYRLGSDETIQHPGLGLGLYICRRIIELHGGTVGVRSEPGSGSVFYFEIPKRRMEHGAA